MTLASCAATVDDDEELRTTAASLVDSLLLAVRGTILARLLADSQSQCSQSVGGGLVCMQAVHWLPTVPAVAVAPIWTSLALHLRSLCETSVRFGVEKVCTNTAARLQLIRVWHFASGVVGLQREAGGVVDRLGEHARALEQVIAQASAPVVPGPSL